MKPSKFQFITLLYILFSLSVFANDKVLTSVESLVKEKKYATAFEMLNENDPQNDNPTLSIAKVDLLMDYYVKTEMFQRFGIKDLLPNQNLDDLRKDDLPIRMIDYKPDSILLKLTKQHPNNYKTHKALGNYYYETYLEYQENWLVPDSVLIENIRHYNQLAYENGAFDFWSLFELGYANLLQDNNEEAIKFLTKSVELNKNYALSHYNLACAYHNVGNSDKALSHAINAFKLEKVDDYKAEAARLVAISFEEKKDYEKALEYYKKSNEIQPNDYNTLLSILSIDLLVGDREYNFVAEQMLNLSPSNPAIYIDLLKAYSETEHDVDFVKFLDQMKQKHRANHSAMANIYLYQAIVQYDMEEWVAAKLNFEKSRSLFRNLYSSDHSVFRVIDSYTKAIRKQI